MRNGVRASLCGLLTVSLLLGSGSTMAQQPSNAADISRDRLAALARAWNDRLPYVPGEVLVKFRPGTDERGRARALAVMRQGSAPATARWVGEVLVASAAAEPDPRAAAALLERQPEVEWAQPNFLRRLDAVPNDPSYSRQWNFDLIELPRAWDINQGAEGRVVVAVVDTGVTSADGTLSTPLWTGSRFETVAIPFRVSPDISPGRIRTGRDFTFFAPIAGGLVRDMVGHGTHVASTIVEETNNNFGLAGIAYRATLLPLKACYGFWEIQIALSRAGVPGFVDTSADGGCEDPDVAMAIRFAADAGAAVINVSIGGEGEAPILRDAIEYAVRRGSFVALSGGNSFDEGNPVEYPAGYGPQVDGAVTVGAVGRSRRRAFYSNTGTHVEVVAPGGDITDGGLSGLVFQASLCEDDFFPEDVVVPRFDRYCEEPSQGTSMAAPHVAGLAALLYSQGIDQPAAIEAALARFARDLGSPGRDDEYGHGLIDARRTLLGLGVVR